MNSTISSVNLNTANYVSRASGKPAAREEAALETPGETVSISDAPATERRTGSRGLGMIGRAAAVLACAAALSGCAVTTGGFGPYGYHTETVGITPHGQVYQHNTQITPWGTSQQGTSVGPNGTYIYQNNQPNWYGPRHYHPGPRCTPMTYWSPGTCY